MRDLDHGENAVPLIDGSAAFGRPIQVEVSAANETQVRSTVAVGLRLIAQGIILIADARGDKCGTRPVYCKAARRTGVRLPPEPTSAVASEAEVTAAARPRAARHSRGLTTYLRNATNDSASQTR